jgi:hypothetical protein
MKERCTKSKGNVAVVDKQPSPYSPVADPIPERGANSLQSGKVREFAQGLSWHVLAESTGVTTTATIDQRDFSVYRLRGRKRFSVLLSK